MSWEWGYGSGPDPERPVHPDHLPPPAPEPFDAAEARAVLACPHREKADGGCQPHRCKAGLGDGCEGDFTSWSNCLKCVRSKPHRPRV